ncbi:zinc-binding dehydrogenase [Spongiactinospora gelatinilytica]|uniref:alcohol dehydrogenase n=1 Tax=Spongiactinospora gelatinilytica TaxID=2666298 RepID=A0A2W2GNL6_9ACTN|nr:alcohol dehydrogenase catalytic domain-containing protein [Spongiactinospora gelatinilytica]PZG41645.1 zinc-binding dehydrogenase [Spongiactinospora gelatinilytica]
MKAVVALETGPPEVMRWTDVTPPEVAPDECLVQVEACGACMHEVLVRRGDRKEGAGFPIIPGHEVVGVIVQTGAEVTGFAVGDRVVSNQRQRVCGKCRECRMGRETRCPHKVFLGDIGLNGGYAELVAVSDGSLVKVPPGITSPDIAIASCAIGTQLNALRDVAHLELGETVLVTGAGGGVGLHAIQLAKVSGARVIAQTTSEDKVEAVRAAGADEIVLTARGQDYAKDVLAVTDGRGCDVVLENVGAVSFPSAVATLALHGRLVLVGEVQKTPPPVTANLNGWRARDITIRSAASTTKRQLEDVLTLVERGLVTPVVTATLPMSQAPEAHRILENGQATGRILLVPDAS